MAGKLRKLNDAIKEAKKSPDFMIGHAYFINESDGNFTRIMNNKIIPLLYEYFNGRENFVEDILKAADLNIVKDERSFLWTVQ